MKGEADYVTQVDFSVQAYLKQRLLALAPQAGFLAEEQVSEVIRQHAFELITRQEVIHLVENVKKTAPELVEEAFPGLIPYGLFQRILTSLLKEGVPVKDLETIIETMIEVVSETGLPVKDIDTIVERIRTALKRTITRMYCEDGSMKVLTLDSELERTMVGSITKGEGGYYLALNPDILQSLIRQMHNDNIRLYIFLQRRVRRMITIFQ